MGFMYVYDYVTRHPLNKGAKLAALGRLLRWQIASRVLKQPVVMPFVENTSLLMEQGMTGATVNWYCGLYELDEMAFLLHALRPADLFADIGANVGSYSVLAGGVVGSRAVSVEPLPATFAKLQRNIAYNNLADRITAHCIGISSEVGTLKFISSLDTMNRVALDGEDAATTEVPVTTLDLLFAAEKPTFIKIDVEGHENWVIEGGERVFGSPELQAIIIETNGSGDKFGVADAELVAKIQRHGFSPHGYDAFTRTIVPLPAGARNTIFVRNPDEMQARCRAARRYHLINGTI
jgi:FkbM family methyltransferase